LLAASRGQLRHGPLAATQHAGARATALQDHFVRGWAGALRRPPPRLAHVRLFGPPRARGKRGSETGTRGTPRRESRGHDANFLHSYVPRALALAGAQLELPAYSSWEVCAKKLLYAITYCHSIDTDFAVCAQYPLLVHQHASRFARGATTHGLFSCGVHRVCVWWRRQPEDTSRDVSSPCRKWGQRTVFYLVCGRVVGERSMFLSLPHIIAELVVFLFLHSALLGCVSLFLREGCAFCYTLYGAQSPVVVREPTSSGKMRTSSPINPLQNNRRGLRPEGYPEEEAAHEKQTDKRQRHPPHSSRREVIPPKKNGLLLRGRPSKPERKQTQ